MSTPLPTFCTEYFDLMERYPNEFCKEQWALKEQVEKTFKNEDLIVRLDLYDKYIRLGTLLGFGDGFEWERFEIGLFWCVFTQDDLPRWTELVDVMGRGAGKDGMISWFGLIGISPYNPVANYDVDICAYNEDQALRPVKDVYDALDSNPAKMKKFFKWTKERIYGLKNGGYIKGHTNNAKGKDGLRSGIVVLNEIHTYENYDNIDIFTTGLGKKKHPRTAYFTTNGYVVDGPLDDMIKQGREVLFEKKDDCGVLYFFCNLDNNDEVDDQERWRKANPSLRYKPELQVEIEKEYRKWKANPISLPAFMTKRMNIRQLKEARPVTSWENIEATNRAIDLDGLAGRECTIGVDFSKTTDWVGVNVHFKDGDERIDLNHAWICTQSADLWRLRCPYKDWAERDLVTLVDEPEISPQLIAGYIHEMDVKYSVQSVCMDSYRYELLKDALKKVGFGADEKNIKLYRPSDIMRVAPVIERYFSTQAFVWGDQPVLRWATNNAKIVPAKKSQLVADGEELDVGNWLYGKIEPHARKTDPFMALVASVIVEDQISDFAPVDLLSMPLVMSF